MTKSISRSQMRLIASTNAIFGADEACAMLRISRDAMYRLAKDPDDPFPIRYIGGKTRDGIVLHDELVAWVERNSVVGSLLWACRTFAIIWLSRKWLSTIKLDWFLWWFTTTFYHERQGNAITFLAVVYQVILLNIWRTLSRRLFGRRGWMTG